MAYIDYIKPEEAQGRLREIYEQISKERGKIANIMKIQSLDPEAMYLHIELYKHLMFGKSGLSRVEREMIGVIVSKINGCEYCIEHHVQALNNYWKDVDRCSQFLKDYRVAELKEREIAILDYVVTLSQKPNEVSKELIQAMRNCGLGDKEILSVNLVASYFNFVNRISTGLDVNFNQSEIGGYKY